MVGGHIITVLSGKRSKTYLVSETDPAKAAVILARALGESSSLEPFPVALDVIKDHGLASGQVKLLHL